MGVEKERSGIPMVDWQVTAKTIHCDAVDDEVTIIVYQDWSTRCTGFHKYTESREEQLNLVRKSLQMRFALECEGVLCTRVAEYKQKLQDEEGIERPAETGPTTAFQGGEQATDEQ